MHFFKLQDVNLVIIEETIKPYNQESSNQWQAVIGLEVHTQLNTLSKLFSPAPNHFGDEPNTNIHPICLGLPGSLPKLNKEAVRKAIILGCALNSHICRISKFDRKSYFYPDAPRNFQITQFYEPILKGGSLKASIDGKTVTFEIDRAHLEDDAGMLKHFTQFAGVDYNRAGAPLIEIVSKPCMHTSKEAAAYVIALKRILQHMNVSDCNMELGQLRIDVNVSVRKLGELTLRPKAEIKNMNSISNLALAIDAEVARQIELYEKHPHLSPDELLAQSTYRWDPDLKTIILMRTKESAADYHYFPEPDLPVILIEEDFVKTIRDNLPESPEDKYKRYIEEWKISTTYADLLIEDKLLSDYLEEAISKLLHPLQYAQTICNWILIEFAGRLKELGLSILSSQIPAVHIAELVHLINQGAINGKIAKSVADDMVKDPLKSPRLIVEENPSYKPLNDSLQIKAIVEQVITEYPQAVQDYHDGKQKSYGFLVGKIMAITRGQGSPILVNQLLKEKLDI
jgi:aspartyl-tRNA(Asn)/glutamyl-tRNA(Gln) amidotransferase subunit B